MRYLCLPVAQERAIDLLEQPVRAAPVAVLDLEMTGLDPGRDRVCEIAVVRSDGAGPPIEFQSLVRPAAPMSPAAFAVHGLTAAELSGAPAFAQIAEQVVAMLDGAVVICHNVPFDLGFLHREFDAAGLRLIPPVSLDTLLISRRLFAFPKNNLGAACERLGVPMEGAHRALADARATWRLFHRMLEVLDPEATMTVGELDELIGALAPNSPMRLRQQKTLREAWRARRTVWIDYQSTEEPLRGVVHREVGIWKLRLPYIQGWCFLRDGERVFRLDRIRHVESGERDYEVPEFDPRI